MLTSAKFGLKDHKKLIFTFSRYKYKVSSHFTICKKSSKDLYVVFIYKTFLQVSTHFYSASVMQRKPFSGLVSFGATGRISFLLISIDYSLLRCSIHLYMHLGKLGGPANSMLQTTSHPVLIVQVFSPGAILKMLFLQLITNASLCKPLASLITSFFCLSLQFLQYS